MAAPNLSRGLHEGSESDTVLLNKLTEITDTNSQNYNTVLANIYAKPLQIVKEFVQSNNRLLYGGIAINNILKQKGRAIYHDTDFPDYDFYSPDNMKDAYAIANKIYLEGFKYTRLIPALHSGTIRVQIDFKIMICDITYLPKAYFDAIPRVKVNGLWQVDANVLKIPLYKTISGIDDIYRWKKDYMRLSLVESFFPTTGGSDAKGAKGAEGTNGPKETKEGKKSTGSLTIAAIVASKKKLPSDTITKIAEQLPIIIGKNNYCLTGHSAFNAYINIKGSEGKGGATIEEKTKEKAKEKTNEKAKEKTKEKTKTKEKVIENYGSCLEVNIFQGNALGIISRIETKMSSDPSESGVVWSYDIYSGETQDIFLPVKYVLRANDVPVLILYDYFNERISKIDIGNNNYVSHLRLISYLYSVLTILYVPPEKHFSKILGTLYTKTSVISMIKKINTAAEKFYNRKGTIKKKTFAHKFNADGSYNIFRVFNTDIIGNKVNEKTAAFKKYLATNKFAHRRHIIKLYEPDFELVDIKNIEFVKRTALIPEVEDSIKSTAKVVVYYPFDYFGAKIFTKVLKAEPDVVKLVDVAEAAKANTNKDTNKTDRSRSDSKRSFDKKINSGPKAVKTKTIKTKTVKNKQ